LRWEFFYVLFAFDDELRVIGPSPTAGPLRTQVRRGFELLLEAIRHAIVRFNARCVAEHDTRFVGRVLDMERLGVLLFSTDELQGEFAPATTDQTLCVRSRITAVEFPDTIPPDSPTPLVAQVGAFFTDGVPVPAAENEVRVTVSASGLNSVSPGEQTVLGPGPATAMVTPFTGGGGGAGSAAVTLNIKTAWKGLFNGESREVVACVGPAALPARAPVARQADGQCVDQPPPPPPPPGQSCEGTQCLFRGSLTVTLDGTVVVPGIDALVTQFIPSAPLPNTVGFAAPGFIGCGFAQSFAYIVTRGDAFTGMSAPNSCLPGSTIQGTVTPSSLDFTVSSPEGFSLSYSGTRVPLP
jgi:hypothetical protein